jgi:transcriptional regulator with XRE-family HTH domain
VAKHWTAESSDALAHKAAFDFIAQVEKRLQTSELKQAELANKLEVSEGAVSKMLNSPQNLTLKTIAKYSRALGIKFAIVAYDDDDQGDEKGLVSSEIFATCWYRAGKPHDMWALEAQPQRAATRGTVYLDTPTHLLVTSTTGENTRPWLDDCLLRLLEPYKNTYANHGTNEGKIGHIFAHTINSALGTWSICPK